MSSKYREGILGYLLALASHEVSANFFNTVRKRGLTVRQWRVLGTLWDEESMTLTALSAVVFCEQSTTTRLVDRLYELGLLAKQVDQADQRKVHVYLTDKGREHIRDLVELSLVEEEKIAKIVGPKKINLMKNQLRDLIDRFTRSLRAEISPEASVRTKTHPVAEPPAASRQTMGDSVPL